MLAPYGYVVTDADLEACVGRSYAHTHAYLSTKAPLPDARAVWPVLSGELFALIDTELAPFEDALTAVAQLRERGVPVAVASSSVRERLDRTLAKAGWSSRSRSPVTRSSTASPRRTCSSPRPSSSASRRSAAR